MNGATPDGRRHPTVHRLSLALARAGVCVVIPDLAGVAGGELSPATLAQAVAVSDATSRSPETADERVALVGVSVGGTLALLAAADSQLQQRISVVACVAPFGDLAEGDAPRDDRHLSGRRTVCNTMHRRRTSASVSRARSRQCSRSPTRPRISAASCARSTTNRARPVELPVRAFRRAGAEAERLYDLLANRDPTPVRQSLRRAARSRP